MIRQLDLELKVNKGEGGLRSVLLLEVFRLWERWGRRGL